MGNEKRKKLNNGDQRDSGNTAGAAGAASDTGKGADGHPGTQGRLDSCEPGRTDGSAVAADTKGDSKGSGHPDQLRAGQCGRLRAAAPCRAR